MNEWTLAEELPDVVADRFEGFQIAAGPATPGLELGQVTVRLSSPGEVAAAVPHFFGFAPDYSVVLLGLTPHGLGGRAALCHGMRVDLDVVERHPSRFARWAAERMMDEGAVESLILIYPRFGAPAIPGMHQRLSTLLCAQFRQLGPRPLDSLFIAGGRWWSFLCEKPDCCPMEGTAIDPAASEVAALSAYSGLVILPSRAALAASLQPYPTDTVERTRAACVALADERARERRRARLAEAAGEEGGEREEQEPVAVHFRAEECVQIVDCVQTGEATRMAERTQLAECIRESDRTQVEGRKPFGAVVIRQREAVHDRDPRDSESGSESGSSAGSGSSSGSSPRSGAVLVPSRGTVLAPTRVGDISFPAWPALNGVLLSHDGRSEQPEPEPIDPSQPVTLDWTEVRALWQLADRLGGEVEGPGWQLADEVAAKLLLGITDVRVRDYLATWCATERAGQAVALSVELARRAVTAEQAAAGYSLAAWASWALGWGAWASLTLERALAAVPDYSLAVLIQTGLARGVGPALVRVASHGTAQRLAGMSDEEGGKG
ncbi:DUF4192 domain-containing protein [Actinospica robiniae]|uniref:DUF4192 domain-containing protein n=1 Tax=Actinospica robiniae TaxID=304901 RepID=UPI0003FC66F6|nr:DUF4192 domain-containing protein [Actinospica robiniae]